MTVRSSHNFVIGDLGFHKLLDNEQHVYERATAPFRKEQFDAAPTVGDQSLAGWWTRGQLSFHKGAGVKYYEVLDGDEVLNRYDDSTGVDPWEPGAVSLGRAFDPVALTAVEDAVGGIEPGGSTPGVVALAGGSLTFADGAVGAVHQSFDASPILSVTSSGQNIYYNTDGAIEGPADGTRSVSNFWPNPRFYAAGTPVSSSAGSPTLTYNDGSLTWSSASGGIAAFNISGLTVGTKYRIVLSVTAAAGTVSLYLAGDTELGAGWGVGDHVASFTANATSTQVQVNLNSGGSYTLRELSVTDDIYDAHPNPYDDPSWSWSGTPNASNAIKVYTSGAYYPLWTPPSGRTWKRVWWTKARLFALDDLGRWYQLSTGGGAATEEDIFWTPRQGVEGWSVAESAGPVFVAKGTAVYVMTPSSDGTVPIISTPVVAASLPTGESIKAIYAYLGRLIICTDSGVRVALIQQDGGLIYGPRVIKGDFGNLTRIAALHDLVYVTGVRDGDSTPSLFALSMVTDVEELAPAYARVAEVSPAGSYGVAVTPDARIMAWDSAGFSRSSASNLQSTGWVQTGFHRMGTLEGKHFAGVKVRAAGTGGTITAHLVDQAGTETELMTLDLATESGGEVTLVNNPPLEAAALKFTLVADALDPTNGPELLGYQIKALPSPVRQRLIRVPLMMFDVERGPTGRAVGKERDAWTRYEALESLEENDALVAFEDKDTGETGTVYIESVELTQKNGSRGRSKSNGFGGVVTVTLRKVA